MLYIYIYIFVCVCVCVCVMQSELNDEFQVRYKKLNIVRTTRLECVGHLVRIFDDGTVKKVFLRKPVGRNKAEPPKLRLLDCVENYLKSKVFKRRRKKAKTDLYVLSFSRRRWLNCKDIMPMKKKIYNLNKYIYIYMCVCVCVYVCVCIYCALPNKCILLKLSILLCYRVCNI
jgi:hypothetical protein